MSQLPDSEGLQVDPRNEHAAKAPELASAYDQHGNYYGPPGYNQEPPKSRIPFGLGVWTFAALVALLTAIVVGAGVGGGLGAALANKSSDCSSDSPAASAATSAAEATDTPTPTTSDSSGTATYVPKAPSDVASLALDCPDKKNKETKYKTSNGWEFNWWCGVNAAQGTPAKDGGIVGDVAPLIAYSIEDCMMACAAMTQRDEDSNSGARCKSFVFGKRMSAEIENLGVNCWLKNASKAEGGNWGFKDDWYAYGEIDDS
ncbi:hypothetical protein ACHAPJ_001935 [Fusarium lateritium]